MRESTLGIIELRMASACNASRQAVFDENELREAQCYVCSAEEYAHT